MHDGYSTGLGLRGAGLDIASGSSLTCKRTSVTWRQERLERCANTWAGRR